MKRIALIVSGCMLFACLSFGQDSLSNRNNKPSGKTKVSNKQTDKGMDDSSTKKKHTNKKGSKTDNSQNNSTSPNTNNPGPMGK